MRFDLAIVGGSFAGLSCAQAAAHRGLSTVVLDRKRDLGEHPHTTGILVKEVADLWDVPRNLTRKIHGVRLHGPSHDAIDLTRPGYHFLATDTPNLIRWWARQARAAGAVVLPGHAFRGGVTDGDTVLVDAGRTVHARLLVGADGANSPVARHFNLGRNRRFLRGVEAEFRGVRGLDEDRLHVFLDSTHAPGYIGWAVPGVGVTQIGLAATDGRPLALKSFLRSLRPLFDFTHASLVAHRAGKIPAGGPVRPLGRGPVLLVGDAAGMVSPVTAGGIHTAVDLGRQLGLAACDHLLDAGPHPLAALRRLAPRDRVKAVLRRAFDLAPPPNLAWDLLLRSRLFRSFAQTMFYHHRGLLSAHAWRDVILTLASNRPRPHLI